MSPRAADSLLPLLLLLLPSASPRSFNFTLFQPGNPNITWQGDASPSSSNGSVRLTNDKPRSAGRVLFSRPVRLWDAETGDVASFTTRFFFGVLPLGDSFGDGVAFFLAPNGSAMPNNSGGGSLGLFEKSGSAAPVVAVEFDTKVDRWDPPYPHLSFDVGLARSVATSPWMSRDRLLSLQASVSFDAKSKNLSAILEDTSGMTSTSLIYSPVDVQAALPEWVNVGISASASDDVEAHYLYHWEFNSTLNTGETDLNSTLNTGETDINSTLNTGETDVDPKNSTTGSDKKKRIQLVVVLPAAAAAVVLGGIAIAWTVVQRRRKNTTHMERSVAMGPRMFSYSELQQATDDFHEQRMLGRGGFGRVYLGICGGSRYAIKKFTGDRRAEASFKMQVEAIGGLSHRNVVPLVGWCIEGNQFFIVYEYMPNRSLNLHLFAGQLDYPLLPWDKRYAVVRGLARALRYLHEELGRCVVHRDVKPENVMLDAGLDARLGDFGLAKHVDHGQPMPSTSREIGTWGYMAPEVYNNGRGKPREESDVYSFGVVALEVATGRRAWRRRVAETVDEEESLVPWVRRCYREGDLLAIADKRLGGAFDGERVLEEFGCLVVVGLWCTLHDRRRRPKMGRVVQYLEFDRPVPDVPDVPVDDEQPLLAVASNPPSVSNSVVYLGR